MIDGQNHQLRSEREGEMEERWKKAEDRRGFCNERQKLHSDFPTLPIP
jgi:hypothetical protein